MSAERITFAFVGTIFIAASIAGCANKVSDTIKMEKTTEITAHMTDDGYNMYLKNKVGDNTEILSNAVSDDDTVEDFDAENAPAEMIELDYESVNNGIFINVTNNNDFNTSVDITLGGVTKKVDCLEAGTTMSLFFNVDKTILDNGYIINPKENATPDETMILLVAEKSLLAPNNTELKYMVNPEDYDEATRAKIIELKEKGYDTFDCGSADDYVIKYYCEGNLMGGNDMKASECYSFGNDNSMMAIKIPAGLEYDTAEMEVFTKIRGGQNEK